MNKIEANEAKKLTWPEVRSAGKVSAFLDKWGTDQINPEMFKDMMTDISGLNQAETLEIIFYRLCIGGRL